MHKLTKKSNFGAELHSQTTFPPNWLMMGMGRTTFGMLKKFFRMIRSINNLVVFVLVEKLPLYFDIVFNFLPRKFVILG